MKRKRLARLVSAQEKVRHAKRATVAAGSQALELALAEVETEGATLRRQRSLLRESKDWTEGQLQMAADLVLHADDRMQCAQKDTRERARVLEVAQVQLQEADNDLRRLQKLHEDALSAERLQRRRLEQIAQDEVAASLRRRRGSES